MNRLCAALLCLLLLPTFALADDESLLRNASLPLFAAFYPFATGVIIPRAYADAMNWFKALRFPWWPFAGWLWY